MPSLVVPLKGLYESVLRPIVHKVAEDVKGWTGIADKTPVRFYNETDADTNPGSTNEGGSRNAFGAGSKITITFSERYKEDAVINTALRTQDEPYLFLDKPLNVMLKAIRSYNEVVITFEYRAKSRSEVEAWRNDIKMRMAEDRQPLLHEVEFHYEVPMVVQRMLAHIHDLREKQAGYGQSLEEWFAQSYTKRSTVLTNELGHISHRVISEKMIGLQGWFDFTEPEEADKRSENATWSINFNYHFHYQKPVEMNFVYPNVVHNQLIDKSMRPSKPIYRLEDQPRMDAWPRSRSNYESVSDMTIKPQDPLSGLRVPAWDDWVPVQVPPGTLTVATWMIRILPEDPTFLMNLKDLGSRTFTQMYLDFFEDQRRFLTKRGSAVVHFGLFRGTMPLQEESLYVDEHLVLRSRIPMDMRREYRVRFSMLMDKSILNQDAVNGGNRHPDMLLDLWGSALPELDKDYLGGLIPFEKNIWDWYYDIIGVRPGDYDTTLRNVHGHFVDVRRVQVTTIIASKS